MAKKKAENASFPTQRALQRALGWPWGTFRERFKHPGWPVQRKGPWPTWCVDTLQRWAAQQFGGRRGGLSDEDDPLLQGGTSPQLERYRKIKADLLELELGEKRKTLIPRALLHGVLHRIAGHSRSFGELLRKQYGDQALALWLRTLEGMRRESDGYFKEALEKAGSDAGPGNQGDGPDHGGDGATARQVAGCEG